MTAIDKDLLKRLPRTFVPALNEQFDKWDLLFPVEQRTLQNQLDYLAGLSSGDFDGLFRPVKDLEAKMQLPAWEASSRRISISETSLLVRSPYYPQWRSEVEKVFAKIDAGVEAAKGRKRSPSYRKRPPSVLTQRKPRRSWCNARMVGLVKPWSAPYI